MNLQNLIPLLLHRSDNIHKAKHTDKACIYLPPWARQLTWAIWKPVKRSRCHLSLANCVQVGANALQCAPGLRGISGKVVVVTADDQLTFGGKVLNQPVYIISHLP